MINDSRLAADRKASETKHEWSPNRLTAVHTELRDAAMSTMKCPGILCECTFSMVAKETDHETIGGVFDSPLLHVPELIAW